MQRRQLHRAALMGLLTGPRALWAQAPAKPPVRGGEHKYPFGAVKPPQLLPALPLTTHTGEKTDLRRLTRGRLTAIHFMFTGCTATCPIQGAIFAQAQRKLAGSLPDLQWLSLSIDPLGDDPKALAAWLQRHRAQPGWVAAVPAVKDVETLFGITGRRSADYARDVDRHTAQVFVADRQSRMIYSTPEMPPPEEVVLLLKDLDPLRL